MDHQDDYYFLYQQLPSLDDAVESHDQFIPIVMEEPLGRSTGYLEDAVVGWANRFKRRRVLLYENDKRDDIQHFEDMIQEICNWGCPGDQVENWSNSSEGSKNQEGNARDSISLGEYRAPEITSSSDSLNNSRKESMIEQCGSLATSQHHCSPTESDAKQRKRRKKKVVVGVVCPFTVVKPADVDGTVTLDDINRRILSRPTRPVRHPVGRFACLPCVTAVAGPGLSGKMVVSLTRINTQGRGTITIIRTRG